MEQRPVDRLLRKSLNQLSSGVVHDLEYYGLRAANIGGARVALDVGANRGQTIVSLKLLFPDIVIHAFEPNALFHPCLAQLARCFDDSVHIHPYGLASEEGRIRFYVPCIGEVAYLQEGTTQPEQFVKPWVARRFAQLGPMELAESTVDVRAGDQLNLSPDIVKVDVEGAELDVLKGLQRTIARSHPALLVENSDWDHVTPFLAGLGYDSFRWEHGRQRLVPYYGHSSNSLYLHRSRIPRMARGSQLAPSTRAGTDDAAEVSQFAVGTAKSPRRVMANRRSRILVANFFPAFQPPRSGGEQRYHYLYRHLSRHCDITLLSPTHSDHRFDEVRFSATFRELRVPKAAAFDRLHWALDAKGIGPECSAYVVALASGVEDEYGAHFARGAVDADAIIHDSPFTLPYDRSFGIDGKPRIYNAYNVEHRLARQILQGATAARAVEFIAFLERKLARNAALLFATSDEDRRLLAADFGIPLERIAVAPNGFEPEDLQAPPAVARDQARVVFMGSAHPPNVEAARFIVGHVAPALSSVQFRILGAACNKLGALRLPQNVHLLGLVDEPTKRRELARCTLALNPMRSGSGTNLKMLDYLASGAPVITTPIGARGLGLVDGVDAFIADAVGFAARVSQTLGEPALRESVATAGARKAYSQFTWERIADRFHASIEAMLTSRRAASEKPRALLLHVNDFGVADGVGGGHVRIGELMRELGYEFEVVMLCLTNETSRSDRRLGPHVLEIRIPKTIAHRDAEVAAARGESVSIDDVLASEFCLQNDAFVATFRALAAQARVVVFEHPYLSPLFRHLPDETPVVYSALNVESRLKPELLRGRHDATRRIAQVRDLERAIAERAKLIVCVSEDDRRALREEFERRESIVIENGVRSAPRRSTVGADRYSRGNDRFLGIFVGSAHPPNAEAARFLIEVLAPALPRLDIVIVGSVGSALGAIRVPANVRLLGIVSDNEKNALLARADVALNPMFQGGGSSLKVPDFLASGLPMISTRIGARGYDLENGRHYVEADRGTFVERTRLLLGDGELRERIAKEGRQYATRALDWTILGGRYRRAIDRLIDHSPKLRLLVVTYRFADPPPGGAETFMVNLLRELNRRGTMAIDVATCDIDTIVDHWHFSAAYTREKVGATVPGHVDTIFRFPVDPPPSDTLANCRRLASLWMCETREQASSIHAADPACRLLGGWNFPELGAGSLRRWASREAQIRVDPSATALRVRGHAPKPMHLDIRQGSRVVMPRRIAGSFELETALDAGERIVTLCSDRVYEAEGDPRELAFCASDIAVNDGTSWRSIALEEDFETVCRRIDPVGWVQSLIAIASRRERVDDALFTTVRGPHSSSLERWLEANMPDYDVVLAQGTPFATPAVAGAIAARLDVPVVQLPHFHMEDRYYHWRSYYDVFRAARCVIAAPESAKPAFFEAIGAVSVALPGGGVDIGEFEQGHLERAEVSFRDVHHGSKPFVLVLGRKTGAKRYDLAVHAVAALNRREHNVDLVLIGPDEDRIALAERHVFAYGAQRRSVVLGALASALCLVNMSESESFGIVLLESWLAGRPVIAQRRCMAFADLVVDGENGLLVETVAELAQAIGTYLGDGELAARHARAGRGVAERHGWPRIAHEIETILLEAATASARRGAEAPVIRATA